MAIERKLDEKKADLDASVREQADLDDVAPPEHGSLAVVAVTAGRAVGRAVDYLVARPRRVLGALAAGQVLGTLALAHSAQHNGWVYFQGGDQIWNTTTGWLVGRLHLPPTEISYLWPLVQAPLTWLTGPTYVQALPGIVLLDVLVLSPIALLLMYGIASQVGGRLLGYWTALLWVIAPFVAIVLFDPRYHTKWVDDFLPQALGLTAMADFPSMVVVLAAAYFVVRSLSARRWVDAALAGLFLGAAGGLKPPNLLMGFGAFLAYVVARRWREGLFFLAALVPSILVLAFWKERGLGAIPALAFAQMHVAAGAGPLAFQIPVHRYFQFDVQHWKDQMNQLREFFWSARLAQWAPFAGVLAVLRLRRGAIAALLAGWLGAFIVVKGFSTRASIEENTFWRLLMPAWPAYLLLFASIPLLVPTLARRLGERVQPIATTPARLRWLVVAAVCLVLVPAAATAASNRIEPPTPTVVQEQPDGTTILTPIDKGIHVRTERVGSGERITWSGDGPWRSKVFYRVYRTPHRGPDTLCVTSNVVSWYCYLKADVLETTRSHVYVDRHPVPGATYRIGVGTNWANDPSQGDVFVVSPPVRAARG